MKYHEIIIGGMKSVLAMLTIPLLCASCVYFNPPFDGSGSHPKPSLLYGRFELTQNNDECFRLGLAVRNVKSKEPAYLEFMPTNSVYAVLVNPGIYQIEGFVAINREHELKHRFTFADGKLPKWLNKPFILEPSEGVYLGDYSGRVTYDRIMLEWHVDSLANHYPKTTQELFLANPRLTPISTKSIFNLNWEPTPPIKPVDRPQDEPL